MALAAAYFFPAPISKNVRAATFDIIRHVIEDELPKCKDEWLFMFWGGHGILDSERSRRVFFGDATLDNKRNLDLNNLLELLRSLTLPSRTLMRQVIVVDACGNAYDSLNPQSTLPDYTFPRKYVHSAGRQISLLLSSAKGEKAGHRTPKVAPQPGAVLAASGIYTSAFLEEMRAVPAWPPDFKAIASRLEARFDQFKRDKQAAQTPTISVLRRQ